MDRKAGAHSWDYPGLDGVPKSREHEERFAKRGKPEGQMIKDTSAAAQNSVDGSNTAK
ncbi:hypothetical protein SAMN02745823_02869 [Sporobacter termitidis DSM 10068]|uniref:Uncharacterized protein n=1 Tax=Sporobacter termitidis DSM 10068 TaxID=1123282 RepID=A0A1M5YVN6_9FIRM|nr:hypothetical protein [Sporobacter termitidis]SHI15920.1 hypothetical protein SAMN02745823_02869 [Sporobacter termitidis DSM 10068]